jgi:hypothetical protein
VVFNPLTSYEDPGIVGLPMLGGNATPGSVANCVLQAYAGPSRVWLATFASTAYASIPVTAFTKTHGMMAGDIVIVVGDDVTHVWTMGAGGVRDVVY